MSVAVQDHPRFVTPRYFRERVFSSGKTKFHEMVNAGKIVMVDVGLGRRVVDVPATIAVILAPEKKAD